MQFALYKDAAATDLLTQVTAFEPTAAMSNYVGSSGVRNVTVGTVTSTVFCSSSVASQGGSGVVVDSDITGSTWVLPDPDTSDHYIYTTSGTRIRYTHTVSGTTGYVTILTPEIFDGEQYLLPFTGQLAYKPYDRSEFRPELAWVYGDMIGRRTSDNAVIWRGKALVPVIRLRSITTGTYADWNFESVGTISDNFLDISAYGSLPYKPTRNSRAGGKGVGTYHGRTNGERPDIAARNGVTTFGGSGNGLTYYQLGSVNALHQVISYAYGLGEVRDNSYVRASLVAAYLLPVLTIRKSSAKGVQIADKMYNAASFVPPSTVDMLDLDHISDRKSCWYDFRELDGTGDFLDFTRTKFALFLPFVGTINLNANAMQWKRLQVDYYIDTYNGNIVYWVYTQSVDSDTDQLYGTYSGNCAIEIPLCGAGESGSMLGKITNMVSALGVGAASIAAGNPIGVAGAAAGMIDSLIPTYYVDRSGAVDTNGTSLDGWRISLKISMPHELRVDSSKLLGRPSYFRSAIGSLPQGRHVCQGVDVENIPNATAAEKQQIKMILEGGFFKS